MSNLTVNLIGVKIKYIKKYMRKDEAGKLPNLKRRQTIIDLRKKDYSYQEIADILNIRRSLVCYYINSKLKRSYPQFNS